MAFEEDTLEKACPDCGALHHLKWYRMPLCERITIPCKACGGPLITGRSNREYEQVKLIDNS